MEANNESVHDDSDQVEHRHQDVPANDVPREWGQDELTEPVVTSRLLHLVVDRLQGVSRFVNAAARHFQNDDDDLQALPVGDGLLPASELNVKVIVPLVNSLDGLDVT